MNFESYFAIEKDVHKIYNQNLLPYVIPPYVMNPCSIYDKGDDVLINKNIIHRTERKISLSVSKKVNPMSLLFLFLLLLLLLCEIYRLRRTSEWYITKIPEISMVE